MARPSRAPRPPTMRNCSRSLKDLRSSWLRATPRSVVRVRQVSAVVHLGAGIATTPASKVASPERTGSGDQYSQRGAGPTPPVANPTHRGGWYETASRPKADGRMVMAVSHRLTERDRSIITMLYRHRVFTTDQLAEMFFDNINTAQHRLTTL
jgi:hypothetical protein